MLAMSQNMPGNVPDPRPALGELHEVRARFATAAQMQDAVDKLSLSGFDRADLSLPEVAPPAADATPEAGAKPADTEEDARQERTLGSSMAAAVAALAAGGLTVATGGAAAPAIAAAVVAGGAAGGTAYAVGSAANANEQHDRDAKADSGTLVLSVRAPTAQKRSEAEAILREAGGMDVVTS
jgi:hypothetical protein